MGVLNVTPDSFSDGGKFASTDAAVAHAADMIAQGADLLDLGGESTRPGAARVPAEEQIRRVVPVISAIRKASDIALSIDTTLAAVAEAALDAGATFVNDISAGRDDERLLSLVARRGVPIVLMHMQGQPATMQQAPSYSDVVVEVMQFLKGRIAAAVHAGVNVNRILIDPGYGFGKTFEHNLDLLSRLKELTALGRPILTGTSRKSFIGKITGETDPQHRVFGSAGAVAWTIANGSDVVRVHDPGPIVQVVRVVRAIVERTNPNFPKP